MKVWYDGSGSALGGGPSDPLSPSWFGRRSVSTIRSRQPSWIASFNIPPALAISCYGRFQGSYGGRQEPFWNAPAAAFAGSTPVRWNFFVPPMKLNCVPSLFPPPWLASRLGVNKVLESIELLVRTSVEKLIADALPRLGGEPSTLELQCPE